MDQSAYTHTFALGRATVTIVSEGTGAWPMANALVQPKELWRDLVETDGRDRMPVSFNVALVELPSATVLVDGGIGEPTEENLRQEVGVELKRSPGIGAALAARDLTPEQIDWVAITHRHGDHVAGAVVARDGGYRPAYPRARVVIGSDDYRPPSERSGSDDPLVDRWLDALRDANCLELADRARELAPGFSFIPAPGESPGHGLYRFESDGAVFYGLGDLFHHPVEILHLDWAPQWRDVPRLVSSRRALIERALAEDAQLMTSHFPLPGVGRLRRTAGGVRWEAASV